MACIHRPIISLSGLKLAVLSQKILAVKIVSAVDLCMYVHVRTVYQNV